MGGSIIYAERGGYTNIVSNNTVEVDNGILQTLSFCATFMR